MLLDKTVSMEPEAHPTMVRCFNQRTAANQKVSGGTAMNDGIQFTRRFVAIEPSDRTVGKEPGQTGQRWQQVDNCAALKACLAAKEFAAAVECRYEHTDRGRKGGRRSCGLCIVIIIIILFLRSRR